MNLLGAMCRQPPGASLTLVSPVWMLLICGIDLWAGVSGCLKPESENIATLAVPRNHQTKRGGKWHWNKQLGLLYCPPLSSWPLVTFVQARISVGHVEELSPGGSLVCDGWSVLSLQGCGAEPGAAFGLILKSERLAIQPFFWPIDGALQLIFCLELEFGSRFKQVLSYC